MRIGSPPGGTLGTHGCCPDDTGKGTSLSSEVTVFQSQCLPACMPYGPRAPQGGAGRASCSKGMTWACVAKGLAWRGFEGSGPCRRRALAPCCHVMGALASKRGACVFQPWKRQSFRHFEFHFECIPLRWELGPIRRCWALLAAVWACAGTCMRACAGPCMRACAAPRAGVGRCAHV
jgi:hypothetical protein